MTKKKILILLGSVCLALMLAVPVVVGCAGPAPTPTPTPTPAPTPTPTPAPTPSPTEEQEAPQGDFTYVFSTSTFGTRVGLDPATGMSGAGEATTCHLMFECLLTKNEQGEPIPCLAKSWEIGPDWAYLDFVLQEGVKFQNGEAFTAEDVKFSIERYMRPDLMWNYAGAFEQVVVSVEVLDDYHVRLHLKGPFPAFSQVGADFLFMLPKDYIEEVGDEYFAQHPVGTGPCKLVDFKPNDWLHLETIGNHWRKTPEFKNFYAFLCDDPGTRLAMLKTGEADMAGMEGPQIGEVEADPNLRIIFSKYSKMVSLEPFDVAYPEPSPWKDPRVQEAAVLAIDRESICKNLLYGGAEPWKCFLPPYCLGYDPSIKPDPYDPERAKELLAEAGYADGFDTKFVTYSSYKFMGVIVEYWRAVGIRAKFEVLDHAEWTAQLTSCKTRGAVFYTPEPYWVGGTHPATAWLDQVGPWCGVPIPDWWQEAYAKAMNAASEEAIAEAGREGEILMRESGIWLPMWTEHQAIAIGPRVEEYNAAPGTQYVTRFEYMKLREE